MGMWCVLVYPDGRGSSADKEAQVAHLLNAFRAEESGEKSSENRRYVKKKVTLTFLIIKGMIGQKRDLTRKGQHNRLTFRVHIFRKE